MKKYKILFLVLALCLISTLALTACGDSGEKSTAAPVTAEQAEAMLKALESSQDKDVLLSYMKKILLFDVELPAAASYSGEVRTQQEMSFYAITVTDSSVTPKAYYDSVSALFTEKGFTLIENGAYKSSDFAIMFAINTYGGVFEIFLYAGPEIENAAGTDDDDDGADDDNGGQNLGEISVTIYSRSVRYDGQSHTFKAMSAAPASAEVLFSTDEEQVKEWSEEMPSFTEIGEYTVYIKAVCAGYSDYYSEVTFTVLPVITLSEVQEIISDIEPTDDKDAIIAYLLQLDILIHLPDAESYFADFEDFMGIGVYMITIDGSEADLASYFAELNYLTSQGWSDDDVYTKMTSTNVYYIINFMAFDQDDFAQPTDSRYRVMIYIGEPLE